MVVSYIGHCQLDLVLHFYPIGFWLVCLVQLVADQLMSMCLYKNQSIKFQWFKLTLTKICFY